MAHIKHVVKQGEYLALIAAKYGLDSYKSIWDYPENSELKSKRKNPNILYPDDELFIPEKNPKQESIDTDQRHRFRAHGYVNKLCLLIKDAEQQPVANTDCQLTVESNSFQLTTDSEGKIETQIPTTATSGKIDIQNVSIPISIGHLDPLDKPSGWQARLNNLGYIVGIPDPADEQQILCAVEEFQCDYGLEVDGECGPLTQQKLKEVHGC